MTVALVAFWLTHSIALLATCVLVPSATLLGLGLHKLWADADYAFVSGGPLFGPGYLFGSTHYGHPPAVEAEVASAQTTGAAKVPKVPPPVLRHGSMHERSTGLRREVGSPPLVA